MTISDQAAAPPRRLVLTERYREMLRAVFRFGCLSRDQLMLLCGFGSITRVNAKCGEAVRADILRRKQLPFLVGHGSAQSLYYLGTKSVAFLEADSREVARQIRLVSRWDIRQIEHVRLANQVLVDFIAAVRNTPESDLIDWRSELELRHVFAARELVPDGWVAWKQRGKRFNCFIEADLHTEGLKFWREKTHAYLRYLETGGHSSLFGFRSCRVLVLARSQVRLRNLQHTAAPAQRLFLFSEFSTVNAKTVFAPVWQASEGSSPIRLVDG